MDINKYLSKQYSHPPCFELVADFYVNELGIVLPNYSPRNESLKAIADAFRIALHDQANGFEKIDKPAEYCVVMMAKLPHQTPHHTGIYCEGRLLHALPAGVVYQEFSSVSDQFQKIEYWARNEN